MNHMETSDLVILGGGAAAFAAAIRAHEIGAETVLINDGLPLGGTCVNVGCVPSKTLLHAGEVMRRSVHHGIPGLRIGVEDFSFREVVRDELDLVARLRASKYEAVLSALKHVRHVKGRARFLDANTVEVAGERIRGKKFLIATGSTAVGLPVPGLKEAGFLTHVEALKMKRQPKNLVVIGGGPLGLEFAQMFARFGTKVTVLEYLDRIMAPAEPKLTGRLTEILALEGIAIYTSVRIKEVKAGKSKTILFERDGQEFTVVADEILVASGKTPNTADLGLEAAGVKLDAKKAIVVKEDYSTTAPHIYSAGDVAALPLRFETTAGKEGTYVAENALLGKKRRIDYATVPWTVFTDPELAGVGPTDAEAVKQGVACTCRTVEFEHVPKAHIVKDVRGLIKMVVDRDSRRILGIHILAPRAGDLIAAAMYVVKARMTVDDVVDSVPMFPTLSESIKIAAQSFDHDVTTLSCCT